MRLSSVALSLRGSGKGLGERPVYTKDRIKITRFLGKSRQLTAPIVAVRFLQDDPPICRRTGLWLIAPITPRRAGNSPTNLPLMAKFHVGRAWGTRTSSRAGRGEKACSPRDAMQQPMLSPHLQPWFSRPMPIIGKRPPSMMSPPRRRVQRRAMPTVVFTDHVQCARFEPTARSGIFDDVCTSSTNNLSALPAARSDRSAGYHVICPAMVSDRTPSA